MSVSAASIPFWLLTLSLGGLILVTILIRGDVLMRVAIMATAVVAVPWAWGTAVILGLEEPVLVAEVGRLAFGPLVFVGPALLFLLLALSGNLERYRRWVAVSAVLSAIMCAATWHSDWVVAGAVKSPLGIYLPSLGSLAAVSGLVILLSLGAGLVVSLRGSSRGHDAARTKRVALMAGLVGLATLTGLLADMGLGLYPFSVIPAQLAVILALLALTRHNVTHARGLDWASLYELLIVLGMIPMAMAVTVASADISRGDIVVAAALTAPLFAAVQTLVILIRDHLSHQKRSLSGEISAVIEEYGDTSKQVRNEEELALALQETLDESIGLAESSLLIGEGESALRPVGSEDSIPITEELFHWLIEQRQPLVHAELATRRLGPARDSVDDLFSTLSADVLVPLVDRDVLVGAIAVRSSSGQTIDETESEVLVEVARATARALTYVTLVREAEERMELAKELEVAAAMQHARSPGEARARYETCQVIAHYMPAASFGGDWWMTHELPDGRVVVVIGDVTGRGMPAALVSSTVAGACQTAQNMLGASCEVLSLLELLNDTVIAVGEEEYPMSCFAAVIDLDAGLASFANAGHPFPYRCRKPAARDTAELQTLISRGTRLGTRKPVLQASTVEIEEGDILVFYSDALVDARNSKGRRYGERRLQNVLQRFVHSAGDRACEVIIEDALAYCGDQPLQDDLTLVVVRMERQPDPHIEAEAR